jgi:hypothetical protein
LISPFFPVLRLMGVVSLTHSEPWLAIFDRKCPFPHDGDRSRRSFVMWN